jgi:aldehyde dehydrogenase (NAD+)
MSQKSILDNMRKYFETGITRSFDFRREQLIKFRDSIIRNEKSIHAALYEDLKKSPEECWVTETGIVLSELNNILKKLRSWMEPEPVATNLLNLPSRSRIMREPLGVVLIIGPWNYPFQLLLNPFIGALAAGNCVVLKPSEAAPATSHVMKGIVESIFPPEYVSYVEGDGSTVIPAMMNNFRFDHLFYTGSTAVGKLVYKMAAERLTPVTLELGGKSPCVVEEDANIRVAARRIAVTKFSNAGQMCIAPDYVLIHESRKEAFLEEMRKVIRQFFSERPEESYSYCKIINEKQFDRVIHYMEEGKIFYGGRHDRSRLFIEPTILTDISMDADVMNEEIFGPVLPVIGFWNDQDARSIIAMNPDPLSFYIYTSNKRKEQEWLENVPAGGACVNNSSWHFTNKFLPFGGRGNSGSGFYHGKYSFDTFSHRKSVMKTPTWFDPSIRYPPFNGKLRLFKWVIR